MQFDGRLVAVNGQPGGVFGHDGRIEFAMALDVLDGQIVGVRVIANPDKLQHLQPEARLPAGRSSSDQDSGVGSAVAPTADPVPCASH